MNIVQSDLGRSEEATQRAEKESKETKRAERHARVD
jgi:hypothetical protein